ncbi:Mbov_0392 family ICE element protein [Metamycoplasma hyosynoviae]|uniref:Mbov_0392 family ICE element protein n=1 Tax=Metamycoplasma hyosynoviae TaxID=29559 RepID=UPI000460FBDB|nr:hypothetical protein [Metamycoplasma hyosynoviae]KDE43549.1 hypothetical protein NPL1_00375 [Metamycoplasma hyosynoviae]MDC8900534.1 hypothetical protein [Metamycoplasma hyosynoviae]MDC8937947.1 hypothetical protein [Metamycoplasma hyosynoviae]MDD1366373.1 hypothetical protein [Metamycoplasma hyosynoviae]MDD1373878.1 hypothetical protein [Metamycoplasma hyosynoviae]
MSKQIEDFKMEDINYLFQYAEIDVDDSKILENFNQNLHSLDSDEQLKYKELIISIVEGMAKIDDIFNKKIYQQIIADTNLINLQIIDEFIEEIKNPTIDTLNNLNIYSADSIYDWMENEQIMDAYSFEEIADADIKENGVSANLWYAYEDFDKFVYKPEYIQLDAYLRLEGLSESEIIYSYLSYLSDFNISELLNLD